MTPVVIALSVALVVQTAIFAVERHRLLDAIKVYRSIATGRTGGKAPPAYSAHVQALDRWRHTTKER